MDYNNKNFDKNYLYKKVEEIIKPFNIEDAKKVILQNYEEEKKNCPKEDNFNKFIINDINLYDIYTPFFEIINSYDEDYYINIPLNYIQKYNLEKDYISFFNKKLENNSSLYISFNNIKNFEILKKINIDFSKI